MKVERCRLFTNKIRQENPFFFTQIVSHFLVKFNPKFLFGLCGTFYFFFSRSLANIQLATVKCSLLIKSRKKNTSRTKEKNGRELVY